MNPMFDASSRDEVICLHLNFVKNKLLSMQFSVLCPYLHLDPK